MIRKFKTWLRNWINEDAEDAYNETQVKRRRNPGKPVALIGHSNDVEFGVNPIKLYIYSASGGFVVETRVYDEKRDRSNNNLYLITNHEEMGEELSKIITMTSLTQ